MNKLKLLRKNIDEIDAKIVSLLLKREKEVKKIAVYKKRNNLAVVDKQREKEILNKVIKKIKGKSLEKLIKELFKTIFKYSRKLQK